RRRRGLDLEPHAARLGTPVGRRASFHFFQRWGCKATRRSPPHARPFSRGGIGIYTSSNLREIQFSPSPRCGGGSGWGGERRLTFPPPSQPSPIEGEGVRFLDRSLAVRDLCRYQCAAGRGEKDLHMRSLHVRTGRTDFGRGVGFVLAEVLAE